MIAVRRILAFAVDWLVVALWAGAVFGAVMITSDFQPPRPPNAWAAQLIGLLTMTLPVTLYFAAWVWVPAVVAAPVWWLVSLFSRGRTPYDRWAGANVRHYREG